MALKAVMRSRQYIHPVIAAADSDTPMSDLYLEPSKLEERKQIAIPLYNNIKTKYPSMKAKQGAYVNINCGSSL